MVQENLLFYRISKQLISNDNITTNNLNNIPSTPAERVIVRNQSNYATVMTFEYIKDAVFNGIFNIGYPESGKKIKIAPPLPTKRGALGFKCVSGFYCDEVSVKENKHSHGRFNTNIGYDVALNIVGNVALNKKFGELMNEVITTQLSYNRSWDKTIVKTHLGNTLLNPNTLRGTASTISTIPFKTKGLIYYNF